MSLYRTKNIHLLYKILLGSNPFVVRTLALRGGGGETAYKYKLGAGRLIYIYPGR